MVEREEKGEGIGRCSIRCKGERGEGGGYLERKEKGGRKGRE